MKQTIMAVVLLAAFGTASATGTTPVVGGSANSISGSAAYATSSGNGASFSAAINKTWSSVTVGGSQDVDQCDTRSSFNTSGEASVGGKVSTGSISAAGNWSSGNATGGAAAGGLSNANAFGSAGYLGFGIGGVTGFATSTTGNAVVAGRNEGGFVFATNTAGFEAGASSSISSKLWYLKNEAQTNAEAYSISNAFGFGNADIYNTNGGTAGAGAFSFAGEKTSVD